MQCGRNRGNRFEQEGSGILIIGVAILLRVDNGFLFEIQKPGKWRRQQDGFLRIGMGCIGGTVEEGEALGDALARESFEEIGCEITFDRSTRPFSMQPTGAVSALSPHSVPEGVQFVWEGNDPGYVSGAKVAVYVGSTIGRAEPGDLPALVNLEPGLFYDLGKRSLTIKDVVQRGGILQERQRVPRSAHLMPVGTASRLLELQRLHPGLLRRILGGF